MAYLSAEWRGTEYFPIHDFHHVEYFVGNAKQAVHYNRSAFGFEPHAYWGPETGGRDKVTYVLKKNRQCQMSRNTAEIGKTRDPPCRNDGGKSIADNPTKIFLRSLKTKQMPLIKKGRQQTNKGRLII